MFNEPICHRGPRPESRLNGIRVVDSKKRNKGKQREERGARKVCVRTVVYPLQWQQQLPLGWLSLSAFCQSVNWIA